MNKALDLVHGHRTALTNRDAIRLQIARGKTAANLSNEAKRHRTRLTPNKPFEASVGHSLAMNNQWNRQTVYLTPNWMPIVMSPKGIFFSINLNTGNRNYRPVIGYVLNRNTQNPIPVGPNTPLPVNNDPKLYSKKRVQTVTQYKKKRIKDKRIAQRLIRLHNLLPIADPRAVRNRFSSKNIKFLENHNTHEFKNNYLSLARLHKV